MKIGIFHGYELSGSGSNEYTHYLSQYLSKLGHEVHILCREQNPKEFHYIKEAKKWNPDGSFQKILDNPDIKTGCILHQLPHSEIRPVYLNDKQRSGEVRLFTELSDEELFRYHRFHERVLSEVLANEKLDVLHVNHLVYQPILAMEACEKTKTPYIIYPHGSSIEYTIKRDERYKKLASEAIEKANGLIIGNQEVTTRIENIFPNIKEQIQTKKQIVGVGVDTNLFQAIEPKDKENMIQELINKGEGQGKSPQQTQDLYNKLETEGIQATQLFWDAYDHKSPDKDYCRKLKQIPWGENILIFVGAFTAGKGLQSLIAALPMILEYQPDTHLVIIGSGAYREVLEALVYAMATGNEKLFQDLCGNGMSLDRYGEKAGWDDILYYSQNPVLKKKIFKQGEKLFKHIHFLGRLNHEKLKYVYPCADIAVFPSVVPEAYPLVFMEALSNGVFPMASYFSGFTNAIDELEKYLDKHWVEKMKISVDPQRRIETLVENMLELLSDQELKILPKRLRKIAEDNYDWQIKADEMIGAYQRILSK